MPVVKGTENRKRQKINDNNYALIKMLAENGVTKADIKKALGLSGSTVYRVLASKDVAEYRGMVNTQSDEKRAKKAIVEAKPVNEMLKEAFEPEVKYVNMEWDANISPKLHIIIELLQSIDKKLGSTVEEEPKKRSFFHR